MSSSILRACLAAALLLPLNLAKAAPITWKLFVYADNAKPSPGIGGTIVLDSSTHQIRSWYIYFCPLLPDCQSISASDNGTYSFSSPNVLTFFGPLAGQPGGPLNSLTLAFATPFPGPSSSGIDILPGTATGSGSVYKIYDSTATVIYPILYGSLGTAVSPEPHPFFLLLVGLVLIRLSEP